MTLRLASALDTCRRSKRNTVHILMAAAKAFEGFGDRLLSEIRKMSPKDIKIRISAPQERLYSTWIGGSILASLDTFKKMWVSKREYDEEGRRAIHRKTF
ncbi:beta-centractin [Copidosoma floridanum]|uniref:beta-centractin n=1 Tax=Copidosoma floridanum TaxID=29053 RepID=UPI0006C955B8|nr:beta-centractin [Copidosoma floridanum]